MSKFLFNSNNPMQDYNKKSQSGYTLLFAILISTIVLAVGVSILGLSKKEILLTAGARETQIALYSADDGMECALYWDRAGVFATSSTVAAIRCNDQSIALTRVPLSGGAGQVNMRITSPTDLRCSLVSVDKSYSSLGALGSGVKYLGTVITSSGYNICGNSPKKVERQLQITY